MVNYIVQRVMSNIKSCEKYLMKYKRLLSDYLKKIII